MKKILSLLTSIIILFAAAGLVSGCSGRSKRPQIKIVLEDGREITFVLYRDYSEQTVDHFIKLCEDGFYDNTAISDFQTISGRILMGDYEWNEDKDDLIEKSLENVPTVEGEFPDNGHTVKYNPLLHGFGTLSLYNDWGDGLNTDSSSRNSGQAVFFISSQANTSYDKKFAVFGKVSGSSSEKVLTDIFAVETTAAEDYAYADLNSEYGIILPSEPIIIKTIKVIKK